MMEAWQLDSAELRMGLWKYGNVIWAAMAARYVDRGSRAIAGTQRGSFILASHPLNRSYNYLCQSLESCVRLYSLCAPSSAP